MEKKKKVKVAPAKNSSSGGMARVHLLAGLLTVCWEIMFYLPKTTLF